MLKAVFFDFWGTIVENGTYSPLRQTYKILRVSMPFSQFAEQFERIMWTKTFEVQADGFSQVCESFNVEPKPFIIERLIGVWNKNKLLAKVYPDTLDTLKALKDKGLKLVLVCNCPENSVEDVMARFGLAELFDELALSYKEGTLKHEALFDVAMKKVDVKPEEVLAVGDSMETDIKGASKAGIKACLVDRRDRREYETKIKSLSELVPLVEELS